MELGGGARGAEDGAVPRDAWAPPFSTACASVPFRGSRGLRRALAVRVRVDGQQVAEAVQVAEEALHLACLEDDRDEAHAGE